MSYDERDWEVVDYQVYELGEEKLPARGPRPAELPKGGYLVCFGAAQTFGAFCEKPYPALLQERLGMPVLNLGFGGAGPSFFLKHPELISLANDAAAVVVQVMSARSVSNSKYESDGTDFLVSKASGEKLSGQETFARSLEKDLGWWKFRGKRHVAKALAAVGGLSTKKMVRENRTNYVAEYEALMDKLTVPKVLLWWSQRPPAYTEHYDRVQALFSAYPQLVNQPMVDAIKPKAARYVESVTSRGMPQRLISRFTGEPTTVRDSDARSDLDSEPMTHNHYYPSPEMHEDVADALGPVCKELLGR